MAISLELKKITEQRIRNLPKDVRRALREVRWIDAVEKISKNFNLDGRKSDIFTLETMLVALGIESPQNFPENLATKLEIDDNRAVQISKEVGDLVFAPLKEASEKTQSQNRTGFTPQKSGFQQKFLEDTKGNADNIVPDLRFKDRDLRVNNNFDKQNSSEQVSTAVEDRLQKLSDKNLDNKVISEQYASGKDPYREPLN